MNSNLTSEESLLTDLALAACFAAFFSCETALAWPRTISLSKSKKCNSKLKVSLQDMAFFVELEIILIY